ncbi:MAG: BamA/TamA family outer membrane protein [Vicinamibacterales bacterium]
MLGDRSLVTAFQANATVDSSFSYRDLGGMVGYSDRTRRWQWALAAEQTPYRSGYVQGGVGVVDGQAALVTEEVIDRLTVQAVSGVAAYPVSESRRLEVGAGIQRYTFTEQVRTILTVGGQDISDDRRRIELPGFTLSRAMAAYVFDRSSFGATSPVLGVRSRFEVAPTVGTVRYTGVLADYRRYVMPLPFYTLAGRLLHYGRYGAGADDPRLSPLFLGYPELVRGYDVGSFRADECTSEDCPVFARLVGSRLLVANAELRFPLLRPFGVRGGMYGPVPVELAVFGDAGVAWQRGSSPARLGGDRAWVSSAGLAARVNAFGMAVVQVSAARPFQRPGRGWIFQVSLTPGF